MQLTNLLYLDDMFLISHHLMTKFKRMTTNCEIYFGYSVVFRYPYRLKNQFKSIVCINIVYKHSSVIRWKICGG